MDRGTHRDLEAANEEPEGFVCSVSHDLHGPLRRLDGFSQALEEDRGGGLDAHVVTNWKGSTAARSPGHRDLQ